jgi:hypothetical protein
VCGMRRGERGRKREREGERGKGYMVYEMMR